MRKLKLFIAVLALIGGVGTASAQKDVTSQYITNATLSSLNGWTNVNFNTPQKGNNTTGYACEAYAGWGSLTMTSYSLTQTITLPAGHYTLVNYSFYRYGELYNTDPTKSLAYLKAGDNQEPIKTLGSITAAGYANSQAEGANCFDSKMYRNTLDFTIDADNTSIEIGVTGTHELMRSWMILGMFELINNDIEATMDAPFDVTGYMTNPGFEYRDMTGWTLAGDAVIGTQNNNQSFKVGGYYAEKWQQTGALPAGSMSQTLTNLPAGYYKLTANLGGDGTYIDLNGKTVSWTADGNYTAGYVLGEDEDLTITAGKTEEGTANWIHFDNFKLYFCGDVAAALTTLLEQVSDYEGKIPSAAYSALRTNVAAYDQSHSDVDELVAAINAVQALYDAANLLVDPYTAWLAAKAAAEKYDAEGISSVVTEQSAIVEAATDAATITTATTTVTALTTAYAAWDALYTNAGELVDVDNDNNEANQTLRAAISEQAPVASAATTADDINAATSALKAAMKTYVFAATPVGEGAQFDCTFLMTNPDLTGLPTWEKCDGWTSENSDGNYQVMVNDSKTVTVDGVTYDYFYEYWSNPAKANGNFALYNAVTLPAGTFEMTCFAFAEDQYTTTKNSAVFFYANDTQGSKVDAAVLTQQSISFNNSEEQEVKIGLKTLEGNTYNWMGIGYVGLYKVPAKTTAYAINVEATNATVTVMQGEEEITESLPLETVTLNVTPDEGYAIKEVVAMAGETSLDVANPSEGVYTFQMPEADVDVTVTAEVDLTNLATLLAEAEDILADLEVNNGDGVFQMPTASYTDFQNKVNTIKAQADAADTPAKVANVVEALEAALDNIGNAELNAPADGQRYYWLVANESHSQEGHAVTAYLDNTTDNNPTGYGFTGINAINTNLAQAFIFTQVEGNNYNISIERPEGMVYLTYGTNNGSAASWSDSQIQATTDEENAGLFRVAFSNKANTFYLINTLNNTQIVCQQGGNIYTEAGNNYFSVAEAEQATATVAIDADVQYATCILPFPAEIDGVVAYSCAEVSGSKLTLVEESELKADTPYILFAESGLASKNLTNWGMAAAMTTTGGLLTGVYADQAAPAGSYVMQQLNDKVGFYKVAEAEEMPVVNANHCYMTVPVEEARAAFFFGDDTTTAISAIEALTSGNAQIFNANGTQLPRLQKGVNIIRQADGKSFKVVVK